ncbi:MAG TPA: hypothetical protein VLA96_00145 [Terriglobales bacterium]|nr:hypothetical protein [Terriglobales bacterium]
MGFWEKLVPPSEKAMAAKTANWPTGTAKVHEWDIDTEHGKPAVTFAYSYEAQGDFWGGEARIPCATVKAAEELGERMTLLAFTVRYSPDDPSKSWVDLSQFRDLLGMPVE